MSLAERTHSFSGCTMVSRAWDQGVPVGPFKTGFKHHQKKSEDKGWGKESREAGTQPGRVNIWHPLPSITWKP